VKPEIENALAARVLGTAVSIKSTAKYIPPILAHHMKCSRSLHETVVLLHVCTLTVPKVEDRERHEVTPLDECGLYRAVIQFGYMEVPNIVPIPEQIAQSGALPLDLQNVTCYVGHETTLNTNAGNMGRIAETLFGYLQRNAAKVEHEFGMPRERVIEIGSRINL
jgi:KUP system potassium uptake protein